MFSTLLFYFILCRTKRHFRDEAANIILDGLLSDEDDASLNKSHLSSDSYSESAYSDSSETELFLVLLILKSCNNNNLNIQIVENFSWKQLG